MFDLIIATVVAGLIGAAVLVTRLIDRERKARREPLRF